MGSSTAASHPAHDIASCLVGGLRDGAPAFKHISHGGEGGGGLRGWPGGWAGGSPGSHGGPVALLQFPPPLLLVQKRAPVHSFISIPELSITETCVYAGAGRRGADSC